VVLIATQPYATDLIASNREWYRYEWIWVKSRKTGFVRAAAKPLRQHENILVFSEGTTISPVRSKRTMPYYPPIVPISQEQRYLKPLDRGAASAGYKENKRNRLHAAEFTGYPSTVLYYASDTLGLHPVAKPVPLLRFLIETYTRPGNLVLDSTMGSGSCAVACVASGRRRFIGIERDEDFFCRAAQAIRAVHSVTSATPSSPHSGVAESGPWPVRGWLP
jgi:site-specific DNA-methyltransferase (adenine-specific)